MDWKQFVVDMTSHIVWPTAFVLFLFMFRSDMARIVRRIAHLKYKDLEVNFENLEAQSRDLSMNSDDLTPTRGDQISDKKVLPVSYPISLEDQMLDAVDTAPSAAILLAWSGVETAMASAVNRLKISPDAPPYRSPMHNIDALRRYSTLSAKQGNLLTEMRQIRNKIAHEQDEIYAISPNQVKNYVNSAIKMARQFEKLQGKDSI
jgi:hypothetical protein